MGDISRDEREGIRLASDLCMSDWKAFLEER